METWKKKNLGLHGNHVVCYDDQPWMSNFEKLRKRGSGFKSLLLVKLLEETLKRRDCVKSCGKHGVETTKHGLCFRHADVEERQACQSFPADSRCLTRCVHLNQPEIWVHNHHSFQQPLRLLLYLLPQSLALFSFYRWGNRKGSTPYPSSRGCSVSEQGSQLMIQGFFSRLLADLHLLPFFSNFLVHISPRTVVIRWLSYVQLFRTPWIAARQASRSFTISWSLLKLMSIELVMPSNHLILCRPFLLLPSVFPSISLFPTTQLFASGGQTIAASASASVLPMNIQDWFRLQLIVWISLQPKGLSRVFCNTTVQKRQFFSAQPSLWSNSYIRTWLLEKP